MDKYSDLSRIGEGSFGRVYKATENATKKTVALKVITKVRAPFSLSVSPVVIFIFPFAARKILERTETPP